jgi:hypothetical protein
VPSFTAKYILLNNNATPRSNTTTPIIAQDTPNSPSTLLTKPSHPNNYAKAIIQEEDEEVNYQSYNKARKGINVEFQLRDISDHQSKRVAERHAVRNIM